MRGTYGEPKSFCFDALCKDEPIVDNPKFETYNLKNRMDEFSRYVYQQANKNF